MIKCDICKGEATTLSHTPGGAEHSEREFHYLCEHHLEQLKPLNGGRFLKDLNREYDL